VELGLFPDYTYQRADKRKSRQERWWFTRVLRESKQKTKEQIGGRDAACYQGRDRHHG
jgi:hypothetical protein